MEIVIEGSKSFKEKTRKALELLEGSPTFQALKPFLKKIRELGHSGMDVLNKVFWVSKRFWEPSTIEWYASSIAHDTFHSFLFHEGLPFSGEAAEKLCLVLQIAVLYELKAPEKYIEWCLEWLKDPSYIYGKPWY